MIATNGGSAALLAYIICAIFVAVRCNCSQMVIFFDMDPPHPSYASAFLHLIS